MKMATLSEGLKILLKYDPDGTFEHTRTSGYYESLRKLQNESAVGTAHADAIHNFYLKIIDAADFDVIVPAYIIDGSETLYWCSEHEMLEIELFSGEKFHWFYHNRLTGRIKGTEEAICDGIVPRVFLQLLKEVIANETAEIAASRPRTSVL